MAVPGKSKALSVRGTTEEAPSIHIAYVNTATYYRVFIRSAQNVVVHDDWYSAEELGSDGEALVVRINSNFARGVYFVWIATWNLTGLGPWSEREEFEIEDPPPAEPESFESLLWVDPLGLKPGSPNVEASLDPLEAGGGLGASGVVIKALEGEGPRRVEMGLSVPPGLLVKGVRLCYEVSSEAFSIDEVRILQLQDPPTSDALVFQDETDLTSAEAVCVDTAEAEELIDPTAGSLRLQLILTGPETVSPEDCIIIHGLGIHAVSDPESPLIKLISRVDQLERELRGHTHEYLTGRGVGHNNTRARTSTASTDSATR